MSRPDNAVNEQHLQAPKPGDMWHERFCPYHIVLAVTERGLIIADKTKREGPCHYYFDLDSAKEITHDEHRNIVRYKSHDGFVADVVPERCLGAVEEWIAAGKKHVSLAEVADAQLALEARRELKPIPISAAERIAKAYGYDQVIIVARKVGQAPDPNGEHVTTYGVDREHCGVAARIGDFLKFKVMGWVKDGGES